MSFVRSKSDTIPVAMREVPISGGFVALVDDADYSLVSRFKWYVNPRRRTNYALRFMRKKTGDATSKRGEYLHHLLIGHVQVDHRDGNGLNNQRENLRTASGTQNSANRRKMAFPTASKFKGVHLSRKRWRSRVRLSGKFIECGTFGTEEEAARAYDAMARKVYGEFARTNFP